MQIKRRYWPADDPADRLGVAAARALSVFSIMAAAVGSGLTLVNLRYLPEDAFILTLSALTSLTCALAPAYINSGRPGFAMRARVLGGFVVASLVVLALINGRVTNVSNVLLIPIVLTFTLILGGRDGLIAALVAAATQAATWVMYTVSGEAPHWAPQLAAAMMASTLFAWAGASVFRREMAAAMEALSQEKRRAEAADRAKSQFLANMSHEIRTPLNGVLGMADVLAASSLDDAQRRSVLLIRACGDQLLSTLNDILDLSKIEAGRMALEADAFALSEVFDHVESLHGEAAQAKGVDFIVRLEPGFDFTAPRMGDRLRLTQVLGNLLSNAVKFTREGAVTLEAAPGGGVDEIVITVTDTGCGMSEDELAAVFEPFAQADASTTRRFGGTGLGLSIVHRIVDLMDGSLDAASAPGEGSRFTVRLALPPADPEGAEHDEDETPAPDLVAGLKDIRVLVADDSETNRLVAAGLLRPAEARVRLASNGREAVELFAAEAFDLVLMDIRMPEMGGIAALRAIRAAPRGAGVPVIAMTANVMDHQIRIYRAEGFDGVVAKPLRPDALLDTILEARAPRRGAA